MREGTDPTTPTAHYSFLSPLFSVINSRNLNSMANGSLMRISPFAFFFALTGEHPSNHKQLIKGTKVNLPRLDATNPSKPEPCLSWTLLGRSPNLSDSAARQFTRDIRFYLEQEHGERGVSEYQGVVCLEFEGEGAGHAWDDYHGLCQDSLFVWTQDSELSRAGKGDSN